MERTFNDVMRSAKWSVTWRWRRFKRRWIKPHDDVVKITLRAYCDENLAPTSQLGIHRIKTNYWGSFVSITLSRPGLLIGRRGATIGEIQEDLERVLKHKVRVHIIEFDPFDY